MSMSRKNAGFLRRITDISNNAHIIGAGANGLVVDDNGCVVVKLLYDLHGHKNMQQEARIQESARNILKNTVHVPKVHEVLSHPTQFQNIPYLCGILMDKVPIVDGLPSACHVLLGYDQNDIDTEWSRNHRDPVSPTNPTRGFHASPEMMEAIWEDEGGSSWTIDAIAYTMGNALRKLIDNGIVPFDMEWIYGGYGMLHLIDFGLCEFGIVDPMKYLHAKGSWGLGGDYYIPHEEHRGYKAFLEGYTR